MLSRQKKYCVPLSLLQLFFLSSSLVIIPEQQYKHSDIEGQKSHDCLLEQALLYSMHLALYPKVEQHCQTNSGMKKNV